MRCWRELRWETSGDEFIRQADGRSVAIIDCCIGISMSLSFKLSICLVGGTRRRGYTDHHGHAPHFFSIVIHSDRASRRGA